MPTAAAEVRERPNVLFILADDLGYSDLSCMGSTYYETPNIDRLAAMGMTFRNGYAGSRVCSPSRATLLTGQFTSGHGVTDWIGAFAGTEWRKKKRHDQLLPAEYVRTLPDSLTVLPEAFRAAGYQTFFAGKWHLGGKGSWPEDHGFTINRGGWDSGSPKGGYFAPFNNPRLPNQQKGENLTLRLAQETADFITAHRDTSFFAYLSFYAVHGPVQSTQEKWAKYREKALAQGVADTGFAMGDVLPVRQYQDYPVYAGLVEQMDDAVGLVLDRLDSLGLLDNTIIVFTSDNGGVVSGDGYATNLAPLRGGKGYQWEGGLKVPYLIYAPSVTAAGSEHLDPVSGADFFPTLLDLAGLADTGQALLLDGQSLRPALAGGGLPERDLFWHYPHYGNQGGKPSSIIRRGDYKLIHFYETGKDALYHLPSDPSEQHDLAAEKPDTTRALVAALQHHLAQRQANVPAPDPAFDPLARKKVLETYRTKLISRLEATRKAQYAADWSPNPDWWGSQVTRD